MMLDALPKRAKIRKEDIKLVPMPAPNMPDALAHGLVDAIFAIPPADTVAERKYHARTIANATELVPYAGLSTFALSREFANANPEAAKKLYRACIRFSRWIDDNPADARKVAAKNLDLPADLAAHMRIPLFARNIFSFFPEYADLRTPEKDRITLRHLLSMTSGLDWPERAVSINNPANIVRQARIAPDPYRAVLERSVGAPPGTAWNYNSGGVWLLGRILKKVSGLPLDRFAKEALFEPLGIKDLAWERLPNGDPNASGGLQLRPRDLAKLGQLVLDDGVWQGRQIVSVGWIKEMTTRHSPDGMWFGFARGYGYLWWLGRSSIGRRDIDWVGSLGWGGQRLYAVPELGLVVAVTAGAYGSSQGGAPSAQENLAGDTALNTFVLPAALGH